MYPLDANAVQYDILKKRKKTKTNLAEHEEHHFYSKEDYLKLMDVYEKQVLVPDVLRSFNENQHVDNWTGDVPQKTLFESWKKLRQLCGISIIL